MKKLIILTIFIIIVGSIGALWWNNGNSPADPKDKTPQIFVIRQGESIREIGNNLKTKKLIKDPVVFFLLVKKLGLDKKIQAGDFRLSPSMTAYKIADALTHGTIDIWATIPEGQRAEEIAEMLKKKIPTYEESWRDILNANEGYLFPDTYLIPKDANIKTVVAIMKDNLYSKIKKINLSPSDARLKEIIIIASLIEREAITNEEKPTIASVIYNRLKDSMSLDIDATLQYIKRGGPSGNWWSIPTAEDKNINSPYNTYINVGLPPGPISNPGLESIKAALNPQKTDYYYYLHDSQKRVHFSKTLEEHNHNIKRYGL